MMCRFCVSDWLPAIAAHKQNFTLKKGQQLFREGDAVTGIYFLYRGKAKVHKRWDKEKELIIRFAQCGDIVGHMAFGGSTEYPVSATMIEAGTVCYISMEFFQSTLRINTDFTLRLLALFANELQVSEKRMRNLAHMSVKGRVAHAILSLKRQFGVDESGYIDIELTRQDISSFTGATYESLFRTINEMVQKGVIKMNGKQILILNEESLIQLTEESITV
jgi:CRP/FNR family transcriptional regulator